MSLKTAHMFFLGVAALFCIVAGIWAFGLTKSLGTRFILLGVGCVVTLFGVIAQGNRFLGRTKDTKWL